MLKKREKTLLDHLTVRCMKAIITEVVILRDLCILSIFLFEFKIELVPAVSKCIKID